MPSLTVTQINRYIAYKLKEDKNLQNISVKGEISGFKKYIRDGKLYFYFSLKDSESIISVVMFDEAVRAVKFSPEDGMSVILTGSVRVFENRGVYQVYANTIEPDGIGAAAIALEQLKRRLAKEGIFDERHKRPLPYMPRKIGVVTSLGGAAVHDICNVISRRYPICELYLVNSLVQGENAPDSICRGILRAENAGCDVIIVGRGGGSSEDLSAFNAEKVAYAVYNCKVPVISAVGHQVDFSLADLAADRRAATPTEAAEYAVPELREIYDRIDNLEHRLKKAALSDFDKSVNRFITLNARLAAQSPENRLKLNGEKLSSLEKRNEAAFARYMERLNSQLGEKTARLDMLSPLKVLSRGYSLVYKEKELVKSVEELETGDTVKVFFGKGKAEAEIKKIL